MTFTIKIHNRYPKTSVKELLEVHFLIPRKIRHFLRTKKHVLVNGKIVHWQNLVQEGDEICLIFDEEDYPDKKILWGDKNLVDCLYQDEHLIIVNKPEGMKTHGNAPDEIALLNHVSAYVGQTCYVIHRLDMETSGAVMFAKNPFVLPILNRLLEDKKISRQYRALAEGRFSRKHQLYTDKIGRHRHDRRKRVVDVRNGQTATTVIDVIKDGTSVSLVNCQLKTGRTHQIRVHLSHHGHAIIGDPLYSQTPAARLMLHAYQLSFTHPFSLENITVQASSPSFETGLAAFGL